MRTIVLQSRSKNTIGSVYVMVTQRCSGSKSRVPLNAWMTVMAQPYRIQSSCFRHANTSRLYVEVMSYLLLLLHRHQFGILHQRSDDAAHCD